MNRCDETNKRNQKRIAKRVWLKEVQLQTDHDSTRFVTQTNAPQLLSIVVDHGTTEKRRLTSLGLGQQTLNHCHVEMHHFNISLWLIIVVCIQICAYRSLSPASHRFPAKQAFFVWG